MPSVRSARKISSYLIRAKLYHFKCGGRRCHVCLNVTESEIFTNPSTNQTLIVVSHEFNCIESSLIYSLTHKICRKQSVGQTVDIFHSRWNNYKSNDRKYLVRDPCIQEYIFEYFNSEGHTVFLENFSSTFIDKTDSQNPEKKRKLLDSYFKDHRTLGP